eukprot:6669263-Pyramimonas_sp.AAC.1
MRGWGLEAAFSAARPSETSKQGSMGRSSYGDPQLPPVVVPPRARAAAFSLACHGGDALKGTNCFSGNNAATLSSMGAFLRSCKLPWVVAGDTNASPNQFWKSGWPQKLSLIHISEPTRPEPI